MIVFASYVRDTSFQTSSNGYGRNKFKTNVEKYGKLGEALLIW